MNKIFLSNLWRWKCGIPEIDPYGKKSFVTYEELSKTEWSPKFETLMRNRLVMGAIRYGRLKSKNKAQYERISSMIRRLELYAQTGNDEYLVDVANMALLEFEEGTHPNKHFSSIDDGEHVKIRK